MSRLYFIYMYTVLGHFLTLRNFFGHKPAWSAIETRIMEDHHTLLAFLVKLLIHWPVHVLCAIVHEVALDVGIL